MEHVDPSFGLVGKILGPKGKYIKHVKDKHGVRCSLRGKGSGHNDFSDDSDANEPMHFHMSAILQSSLDAARVTIEQLLKHVGTEYRKWIVSPPKQQVNASLLPKIVSSGYTPQTQPQPMPTTTTTGTTGTTAMPVPGTPEYDAYVQYYQQYYQYYYQQQGMQAPEGYPTQGQMTGQPQSTEQAQVAPNTEEPHGKTRSAYEREEDPIENAKKKLKVEE